MLQSSQSSPTHLPAARTGGYLRVFVGLLMLVCLRHPSARPPEMRTGLPFAQHRVKRDIRRYFNLWRRHFNPKLWHRSTGPTCRVEGEFHPGESSTQCRTVETPSAKHLKHLNTTGATQVLFRAFRVFQHAPDPQATSGVSTFAAIPSAKRSSLRSNHTRPTKTASDCVLKTENCGDGSAVPT